MARTIPKKAYGGVYGEEASGKSPSDVRNERAKSAASDFAGTEDLASKEAAKVKDNTTSGSTDEAENGDAGHTPQYSGGGGNSKVGGALVKATPAGRFVAKFSRAFKRDGGSKKPLFAIGGLTGIIAVVTMTVSSMLPIHLINNFGDLRNTLGTEMNLRGTKAIKHLFNTPKNEASNLFAKRNTMSNRRITQLNRGLEVQGMRFVPEGSQMVIKVAGVSDLDAGGNINWDAVTTRISTEAEFTARFNDDSAFRNAFNKGARTMTGKNAGWFNSKLAAFLNSNRLTRTLFARFIAEKGDSAVAQARKKIASQTSNLKKDAQALSVKPAEGEGNEGRVEADGAPARTPTEVSARRAAIAADIKAKAEALQKGGGWVALAVGVGCAITLAVAAVSMVYAYQQAMEGLAVVANWFSAGQMPLGGDGNDSYHSFGSALTEGTVTTAVNENGDNIELHGGAKVAAVESAGLQQVLVGGSISNGDLSAAKYNMEKAIDYAKLGIGGVAACTTLLAGAALFGAAIFVLEAIAAVFTGGLSLLIVAGKDIASSILSQQLLGAVVPRVAGLLAMIWATNIATDVFGEDFGNMIANFGSRYFFGGAQANGAVGATYDKALGYYRETQKVLAMQAELDRATKSPFDISSHNTFLGSISSHLVSNAPRSSSMLGVLSTVGSMASSTKGPSFFVPVSALDELEFRQQLAVTEDGTGTCSQLMTINAVGDQFCNPIRVYDLSTVNMDPEDLFWKVAYTCTKDGSGSQLDRCSFKGDQEDVTEADFRAALSRGDPWARCRATNPITGASEWDVSGTRCNGSRYQAYVFEEDARNNGLESINPKSDLEKMVRYGVKRDSDIGALDINIAQAIVGDTPRWVSHIPLVGNIVDAVNQIRTTSPSVLGWATGANICAGCKPEWDTTYKYLSQYIADCSVYEGMGGIEKSPVTAYIEEAILPYEDLSFEGRLAASMGMPKEFVVATLAFAEDLRNVPREAEPLIASAPNIYATYYRVGDPNQLNVPEKDESCKIFDSMRKCMQIAGTELRRRFNAEAVA